MTDLQEAEQAAIRLLAPREHSRLELRRKLLKRDHAPDIIEEALQRLEEHGLLSDERFVEQYIAMRKSKGYGPVRIRQELRERGINDTMIHEWLDERDDEWWVNMKQVVEKKFSALNFFLTTCFMFTRHSSSRSSSHSWIMVSLIPRSRSS